MSSRPLVLVAVLAGILSVLLAVATNLATNQLPTNWQQAPQVVWGLVGLLALATIALGVWQAYAEARRNSGAGGKGAGEPNGQGDGRQRTVPAQLPPDIAEFTGRRHELEQLRTSLVRPVRDRPAVAIAAIAGKPGVGKSALAIHLAHEIAGHFPDGQLYVNLRGTRQRLSPEGALGRFLRALGVPDDQIPVGLDELVALYRSQLYGRRVLVVLDDAADAAQVRPLLPGSPGCSVLVTSRSPLASLDGAGILDLDLLTADEAVELLGRLAGVERVAAEPAAAAAIAGYCGYLPLALRIAGGKLAARSAWSLVGFEARLADEHRRLAELRAGDLEVRASFELSYEELDERDARTFRLIGLLEGSEITPELAATVAEVALDDAEDILDRLADVHLLESPVPGRYRFHDLLRLFARERAAGEDPEAERRAALARAFNWFLGMTAHAVAALALDGRVERRDPVAAGPRRFAGAEAALAWLELERGNLVASVRQAAEQDGLPVHMLALRLGSFFELRKYWPDWVATGEQALRAVERAGGGLGEGRVLENLGMALRDQRRYEQALPYFERSVAVFRRLGNRIGEGRALLSLGTSYRDMERFEEALDCYERCLPILREAGGGLEARVEEGLGAVYRHQGRFEEARAAFERSVPVFNQLRDRRREGRALGQLGRTYAALGRVEEADEAFARGLACLKASGDGHNQARSLLHYGRFHASQGRQQPAAAFLRESAEIFEQFGDAYHEGIARKYYGTVLSDLGDHAEAREQWRAALELLGPRDAGQAADIRAWLET